MIVKAAPGTRCPKEGNPRQYITDSAADDVQDSAYYRRLLADGSLVVIAEKESAPRPKAKAGKTEET